MSESSILDKVISSKQVADIQNFAPADIVANLLKDLSQKEADTLSRRFGLSGLHSDTLEEIGKRFGVTRERVRQIEGAAIQKLKHGRHFADLVHPAEELIRQILEANGGAMTEEHLLMDLFRDHPPREYDDVSVRFLLNVMLTDRFDHVDAADGLRPGWKVKAVLIRPLQQTLDAIVDYLGRTHQAVVVDVLLARLADEPYFRAQPDKLNEEKLVSYLELNPKTGKNPFGEYGLTEWGSIAPRRMNDKIFLVLKKHGKPMHFTEIAQAINEAGFDRRKAYAPTVHNELILNKHYVLIGRGVYALRDWGYKPGVVADVLVDILRGSPHPLKRDELVAKVLEQRQVKKNTIHLALTDQTKFFKHTDGTFSLVSADAATT